MINILFVDDEIDMLKQAEIYLSKQDDSFEIETALSGEEALDLLSKKDFEIIITDYKMPSMDGIELLKEVRGSEIDIPFLILTAAGDEEVAMEALNYGADRYILKEGRVKKQFQILSKEIKQEIEHYNTRRKLIKSESKYENLVNNLPVGIYKTNPKGEIINANKAFSEMLGYSSVRELKAINAFDLFVDPEDRNKWMEKIRKNDIVENFEFKMKKHDGTVIWVEDTARVVKDEEGNIHHFNGIIRDITEIKEIEEELGQSKEWLSLTFNILNSIGDPIITTDREGNVAFINNSAEEFFGIEKDRITGEDFNKHFQIFSKVTDQKLDDPIFYIQNNRDIISNKNAFDINTIKGRRTVVFDGYPIRKKSGNIIGTVITIRDYDDQPIVTEEIKQDKKLEEIIDEISIGIVILSSDDYTPIRFNKTALQHLGYSEKEFKNISIFDWDIEKEKSFTYKNLKESLEKNGRFKTLIIKRNQQKESKNIFSLNLTKEVSKEYILLSLYDITEEIEEARSTSQKSSRYKEAYDAVEEGIVVGKLIEDKRGNPDDIEILDVNSSFQDMMGVEESQIVGKKWSETLFRLDRDDLEKIGISVRTGGKESFKLVNNRTNDKIDVIVISEEGKIVVLVFKKP